MEEEKIKELFKKYRDGKCTEQEKALLEAWYLRFNEDTELDIPESRIKAIGRNMQRELPGNHIAFLGAGFKLIAAILFIGIVVAAALKLTEKPATQSSASVVHDIAPGTNSATLILANGHKIDLSQAGKGALLTQPGINVTKTANGQIVYQVIPANVGSGEIKNNTIATPNGGQWQVILPDGTKVWLNSATSFTYPERFAGSERIVQLNGEAYFEVTKDKLHPFIVKSSGQSVEVLGTHFNINAYRDEAIVKTVLAEGKVKVTLASGGSKYLIPGQQSILSEGSLSVSDANIEEALAWKNGYFRFNDERIQSVMRKLARWYNIDVAFDPGVSGDGMNGKISRFKNISQVLSALEATKTVHFKVEGRRVTVMK